MPPNSSITWKTVAYALAGIIMVVITGACTAVSVNIRNNTVANIKQENVLIVMQRDIEDIKKHVADIRRSINGSP